MPTQLSRFNENADISYIVSWDESRNDYVPVRGSYFDHVEMIRISDDIGEEILKSFSSPKKFFALEKDQDK